MATIYRTIIIMVGGCIVSHCVESTAVVAVVLLVSICTTVVSYQSTYGRTATALRALLVASPRSSTCHAKYEYS